MNREDERELHRLTALLRTAAEAQPSDDIREALEKSALALLVVFVSGSRQVLEDAYASKGLPLNEEQLRHLKLLGLK